MARCKDLYTRFLPYKNLSSWLRNSSRVHECREKFDLLWLNENKADVLSNETLLNLKWGVIFSYKLTRNNLLNNFIVNLIPNLTFVLQCNVDGDQTQSKEYIFNIVPAAEWQKSYVTGATRDQEIIKRIGSVVPGPDFREGISFSVPSSHSHVIISSREETMNYILKEDGIHADMINNIFKLSDLNRARIFQHDFRNGGITNYFSILKNSYFRNKRAYFINGGKSSELLLKFNSSFKKKYAINAIIFNNVLFWDFLKQENMFDELCGDLFMEWMNEKAMNYTITHRLTGRLKSSGLENFYNELYNSVFDLVIDTWNRRKILNTNREMIEKLDILVKNQNNIRNNFAGTHSGYTSLDTDTRKDLIQLNNDIIHYLLS